MWMGRTMGNLNGLQKERGEVVGVLLIGMLVPPNVHRVEPCQSTVIGKTQPPSALASCGGRTSGLQFGLELDGSRRTLTQNMLQEGRLSSSSSSLREETDQLCLQ